MHLLKLHFSKNLKILTEWFGFACPHLDPLLGTTEMDTGGHMGHPHGQWKQEILHKKEDYPRHNQQGNCSHPKLYLQENYLSKKEVAKYRHLILSLALAL